MTLHYDVDSGPTEAQMDAALEYRAEAVRETATDPMDEDQADQMRWFEDYGDVEAEPCDADVMDMEEVVEGDDAFHTFEVLPLE